MSAQTQAPPTDETWPTAAPAVQARIAWRGAGALPRRRRCSRSSSSRLLTPAADTTRFMVVQRAATSSRSRRSPCRRARPRSCCPLAALGARRLGDVLTSAGATVPTWVPLVFGGLVLLAFLVWVMAGNANALPLTVLLTGRADPRRAARLRRARRSALRAVRHHQHRDRGTAARRRVRRRGGREPSPSNPYAGPRRGTGRRCARRLAARAVRRPVLGQPDHRRRRAQRARHRGHELPVLARCCTENAATLNSPPRLPTLPIPLLSEIPVLGPVLFRQSIVVYLHVHRGRRPRGRCCSAAAGACACAPWASTPRPPTPSASRSTGRAAATRVLGGAVAGLGGAFFTVGSVWRSARR